MSRNVIGFEQLEEELDYQERLSILDSTEAIARNHEAYVELFEIYKASSDKTSLAPILGSLVCFGLKLQNRLSDAQLNNPEESA